MSRVYLDRASDDTIEVKVSSGLLGCKTIRFKPNEKAEAEAYAIQRAGNTGVIVSSLDMLPAQLATKRARDARLAAMARGVTCRLESWA